MFSPDLLVVPMYQPGTHRAVYLPKGVWIDYWTGARSRCGWVVVASWLATAWVRR